MPNRKNLAGATLIRKDSTSGIPAPTIENEKTPTTRRESLSASQIPDPEKSHQTNDLEKTKMKEDPNDSIAPEETKPKENDPMAALLNRLLTNQERDAAERVKESKELKDKLDKTEKNPLLLFIYVIR